MTPNQTLVAYGNVIKKITLSLFLVVACNAFAQVGVGTQTPVTTLDVSVGATPTNLATGNGITIPSVTDAATTTVAGTNDGQMVYDTTEKAFYYWNASTSAWTVVGGGGTPAPLNVVVTTTPYTALVTDDIIEFTGTVPGNIVLPAAAPVGKIFYLANTSLMIVSLPEVVTTGANNLPAQSGSAVVHMGGGRYASLWGNF